MRLPLRSLAAAALLAAGLAAPAFAGVDFCLSDPVVRVGHETLEVGLYTEDRPLYDGVDAPITVVLHAAAGEKVKTVAEKWQRHFPTDVDVVKDLAAVPGAEVLRIDATVPAAAGSGSFTLRVTLPDGSVRSASAPAGGTAELTLTLPA